MLNPLSHQLQVSSSDEEAPLQMAGMTLAFWKSLVPNTLIQPHNKQHDAFCSAYHLYHQLQRITDILQPAISCIPS
jgi:hypothetical protein